MSARWAILKLCEEEPDSLTESDVVEVEITETSEGQDAEEKQGGLDEFGECFTMDVVSAHSL